MAAVITKIIYHLLILSVAVTISTARPQNAIESQQETLEYQPNLEQYRSYYPYPSQTGYDNAALEKIQMFVDQGKPGNPGWPLYRMPESKRQVRYRQCYFNPISCFKK